MDVTSDVLRNVSEFVSVLYPDTADVLDGLAEQLEGELRDAAELRKLELMGDLGDAERGWDVLRAFDPGWDSQVGVFADLPHGLKLRYAVFAAGVLGAPREWGCVESIPDGVKFTDEEGIGDFWIREGEGYRYFDDIWGRGPLWAAAQLNEYAPFVEASA